MKPWERGSAGGPPGTASQRARVRGQRCDLPAGLMTVEDPAPWARGFFVKEEVRKLRTLPPPTPGGVAVGELGSREGTLALAACLSPRRRKPCTEPAHSLSP